VTPLSRDESRALRKVLVLRPEVNRALFVSGGERPALVLEYDERPATVDEARTRLQELVVAVSPALSRRAGEIGFSAGGPEDVARFTAGGQVVFERR
jgi:hypothetical protein